MNTKEFGQQEWDTGFQFSLKSQMFLIHTLWLWVEKPKLLSQKFKLLVIYLERFLDFANSFAAMDENFQPLSRIRNIVDHQSPREDSRSLSLSQYLRETPLTTYFKKCGNFWKGFMWNLIRFRQQKALQATMKVKFCKMFMNSPL